MTEKLGSPFDRVARCVFLSMTSPLNLLSGEFPLFPYSDVSLSACIFQTVDLFVSVMCNTWFGKRKQAQKTTTESEPSVYWMVDVFGEATVAQLLEQSSMNPESTVWLLVLTEHMSRCPWTSYWNPIVLITYNMYSCLTTMYPKWSIKYVIISV